MVGFEWLVLDVCGSGVVYGLCVCLLGTTSGAL